MSWLLAAAGLGVAAVLRGVLSVSRARVAKWQDRAARAEYDLHFATEKLAEFIDRTNVAEGLVRAHGLQREANALADAKRGAN